jgi:hypothetical protein
MHKDILIDSSIPLSIEKKKKFFHNRYTPMQVYYPAICVFEYDYIIHDILQYVVNDEMDVIQYHKDNFLSLSLQENVRNILILSDCYPLHDILHVASHMKPVVIIFLSDEAGRCADYMVLERYTSLLLRNYNHPHYSYSSNNLQLPIGYASSFLKKASSLAIQCKTIEERRINCSFIGAEKSDRVYMCSLFRQMSNTRIELVHNPWKLQELAYSPSDLYDIYSDSIFVINGRGWCSLDCFRIYEAIVTGAIPVIVGKESEVQTTFWYNNNIPPLIYADSWENALHICKNLLGRREDLQKIQDRLQEWWHTILSDIINLIQQEVFT